VFPDVIHGFRSTEELGDMDATPESPPPRKTTTVRRTRKTTKAADPAIVEHQPPRAPETSSPDRSLAGEDSPEEASDSGSPSGTPPPPDTLPIDVPTYAAPVPQDEPADPPINSVTRKLMFGQLRRLKLDDDAIGRPRRLDLLKTIAGRDRLDTSADLTQTEATAITTVLATARDAQALDELLAVATASEIAEKIGEEDK
jgi:hypothetical protein